ncbi:MAG TPA: hypothetical protein VGQ39_26050 [Pyrinomonadaceae bacterium]|nr:hypothetical protein [Pyrinomonadaceae bacterium]
MRAQRTEWRWGLLAASAIVILTAIPQFLFLLDRGSSWHGTNAAVHPDEVAYSTYIASLIRGRPRRNDPFTGCTDHSSHPVPESLFSIQIVPAYLSAFPARWLGLSASTVFIIGPLLMAGVSSLTLFWFIALLTRNPRLSATAVCFIYGFGTLIAGQGISRYVPTLNFLIPMWLSDRVLPASAYHLPFLRFYQPAVGFPLFFVFCALVWLALIAPSSRRAQVFALSAGVTFVLLVFSYFYLWTAAGAWLASIAALWLAGRPNERRRSLMVFGFITVIAAPGMLIYFKRLAHRAPTVDSAQALAMTHRPDLFRLSEILVMILLGVLVVGAIRRKLEWRDPLFLFASSFALTVIAIFNQQILTGRSLQPIHYEWFVGNYCALAMIVLTLSLTSPAQRGRLLSHKRLLIVAVVALLWGACEVWLAARLNLDHNRQVDEMRPVAQQLTELAATDGTVQAAQNGGSIPVVLVGDLKLADRLPTDAPQAVLWAPRLLVFPGVSDEENRERFFRQFYLLGYDAASFNQKFAEVDWNFYAGMFPYYRLSRVVSGVSSPIFAEEIREQAQKFREYSDSFTNERAHALVVSYIVLSADIKPNWSNVDRWYVHDEGQRIGTFVLYRLRLKGQF